MRDLHITNGDVAAGLIRESGVEGEIVPWRDVLHQGPVPAGLSLEELSGVRARFVSSAGWGGTFDETRKVFAARDRALKSFKRAAQVTFWFEHDLYDQLQLLQLLHWFARRETGATRLFLICIDRFPGIEPFHGLGQLTPGQMGSLYPQRIEISAEQMELGRSGWDAFTADRPSRVQELVREELSPLPFLRSALCRHLQQFPSTRDGLSRSERQILEVLGEEDTRLRTVFRRSQIDCEEAPFMADLAFLFHVAELGRGERPLLEFEDGIEIPEAGSADLDPGLWDKRLRATEEGQQVHRGQADRERFQRIDCWLGGVHLHGERAGWRWAHQRNEIVEQKF